MSASKVQNTTKNGKLTPLLPEGSREAAQALVLYDSCINKCSHASALQLEVCSLHEGVIDRDDKDLTSILELGVVDEAGNVGARTRRALKNVSPDPI